jgi:hypothetical protein
MDAFMKKNKRDETRHCHIQMLISWTADLKLALSGCFLYADMGNTTGWIRDVLRRVGDFCNLAIFVKSLEPVMNMNKP